MQAITTKFHGPTNTRGARVSARAQDGRITIRWDYSLGTDGNHDAAAHALAEKFGWLRDDSRLIGGGLPDGTGNAYVFLRGATR